MNAKNTGKMNHREAFVKYDDLVAFTQDYPAGTRRLAVVAPPQSQDFRILWRSCSLQVDRNLMLYLPRLAVLVRIEADRPGAWFPGPWGPYLTWFPAI
jgi:hypothetical protein